MPQNRREKGSVRPVGGGELPRAVEEGALGLEAVSAFKTGAEGVLAGLLESNGGDRVKALKAFMVDERAERVRLAKDAAERGRWEDAGNVYIGAFILGYPSLGDISAGRDVKVVSDEVERARQAGTYDNVEEREAIAQAYYAARRRLFPKLG